MNKLSRILGLVLILTGFTVSGAALDADLSDPGSGSGYASDTVSFSVSNSTTISNVTYWVNTSSGYTNDPGNSSDFSNNFEVSWNASSHPDGDGFYHLYANATNMSDNSIISDKITFTIDSVKPSISLVDNTTFEDGNIFIDWDFTEDNPDQWVLWRNDTSGGDWEKLNTFSPTTTQYNDSSTSYTNYVYRIGGSDKAGHSVNSSDTLELDVEDGVKPSVSSRSPGKDAFVSKTDPEVKAEGSDDLSGMDNVTIAFEGDWATGNSSASISASGLNSETEYTVEANLTDKAGNTLETSWNFTVDTSAPDPSVSLKPDQDNLVSETTVEISLSSTSDVDEVRCYVGDPSSDGSQFGSSSSPDDSDDYSCGDLDPADYSEGSHSIYGEICDKAGNCNSKEAGEYVFDTEDPEIDSVEINPEYTNTDPEVTVEASDDGTGVTGAEYDFEDFDGGEGTTVSIENGDDVSFTFEPSLDDLDDGDHTLNLRVEDGSGKYSDLATADFTYDPDANPSAELVYGPIELESGSSTDYSVTVNNTAKVPLTSATLNVSGKASGSSDSFEVAGESSKEVTFEVSSDESFGTYTVDLKLNSVSLEKTVEAELHVMAPDDRKEELDSVLSKQESRLQLLKDNLTRLKEKGARQELVNNLESEINKFEKLVKEAGNASESGDYFSAEEAFKKMDSTGSAAMSALEETRKKHQKNVFYRNLMIGGGVVFLLLVAGGVFFYTSEEYDLHLERVYDSDLSIDSVRDIPRRIKSVFSSKEEAEEFEWDGFE